MKRVLLDVNVVLDVLLDRGPFAAASEHQPNDIYWARSRRAAGSRPA